MARDYCLTAGKPWKESKFVSEIRFEIFSVAYNLQTGSNIAITVTYSVHHNIFKSSQKLEPHCLRI